MRTATLTVSMAASAAVAFGLGFMAHGDPSAPPLSIPAQSADRAPGASPQTDAEPVADTPTKAKHAKPRTTPETAVQRTTAPRHAKATTAATAKAAGASGPFRDAQDDGKVLDDVGKTLFPNGIGVHVPDVLLPFPGRGEGQTDDSGETFLSEDDGPEYPYEEAWGDTPDTAADPGVVCDPVLAADLGVPLGDCEAEPNHMGDWYPETSPMVTAEVAPLTARD